MSRETYHCNCIYNHIEKEQTKDNLLATKFACYLDRKISGWGFKCYLKDRDCLPGTNVFDELFKIVSETEKCLVIITPEFGRNYWAKYCKQAALMYLLREENQHKMIPITLNINDIGLLKELNVNEPIHIEGSDEEDWGKDIYEMRLQKLKKALEHIVTHVAEEQRSISVRSGEILHCPTEESSYLSVDGATTSVNIPDNRHSNMPLPHESQEAINQQDDVAQQFQSLILDTVNSAPDINRSEMMEDDDLSIDTSPAETDNHRPETIGGEISPNLSGNTEVKTDSAPSLGVTATQDKTDLKLPFANEDTPRLPDQRRLYQISVKDSPDSGYTTPSESISRPICSNIENQPEIQTNDQKIKPQDNSSTTECNKVKPASVQSSTSDVIRASAASLPILDEKKPRSALSKIGAFLSLAMESFLYSDLAFKS